MFQLQIVSNRQQQRDFFEVPWKIYHDDPYWVPVPIEMIADQINTRTHPFFQRHDAQFWCVYSNSIPVGRIAAFALRPEFRTETENYATFGYFEAIDQSGVAHLLFHAVLEWAAIQGVAFIRGPINLNLNFYECGLLVDGFDVSPTISRPYNPRYYEKFFISFGFQKAKDLKAYDISPKKLNFSEGDIEKYHYLTNLDGLRIRELNPQNFTQEVTSLFEVYNESLKNNWGFTPFTLDEFLHSANEFKLIYTPYLVTILEVWGEPIGFSLILPDINTIYKKINCRRLFPFGIFKLLWYLKFDNKEFNHNFRSVFLGIKQSHRHLFLGNLLFAENFWKRVPALDPDVQVEASWILEDNRAILDVIENLGGTVKSTYRIYQNNVMQ
ncbi:MAG: hypothetical protein SFY66_13935 [Oculatellaceae cyanobacterium bins.114]|nr:hypothetical protein [Oculatellaceae cyanobacterium bins.114]